MSSSSFVLGQTLSFTRLAQHISVQDDTGNLYDIPFAGGLNIPKIQFFDIDNDSDLDLFIQEIKGDLMFFRNDGTPQTPHFVWVTDTYTGLDIGSWFRFTDLDSDGKADLLFEPQGDFNKVAYYIRSEIPVQPSFVKVSDALLDTNGNPLFVESGVIPVFADIDCDNDPDLFSAKQSGTIVFYRLNGFNQIVPIFEEITQDFGDILLPDSYCATPSGKLTPQKSQQHGAATLSLFDDDADGDLDIFWGDTYTSGVMRFENTGSCANPTFSFPNPIGGVNTTNPAYPNFFFPPNQPVQTAGLNMASFADLNADGKPDFFTTPLGGFCRDYYGDTAHNFLFYQHTESDYQLVSKNFLSMIDIGEGSAPTFIDIDNDGDQDLVIASSESTPDPTTGANFGKLSLFENIGTPTNPAFQLTASNAISLADVYNIAPTFIDIDQDGDDDLFVGEFGGSIQFYRNTQQQFTLVANKYENIDVGNNASPTFGDLDGDGDFDLLIGETFGNINYYENTGTPQAPTWVQQSTAYFDIDVDRSSKPFLYDLDNDNDLDLLIGNEAGKVAFYKNEGTPQIPNFVLDTTIQLEGYPEAKPAVADLDQDQDGDIVIGSVRGGIVFYQNNLLVDKEIELPRETRLSLEMYPNPFQDTVQFEIETTVASVARLEIYTVLGQLIKSSDILLSPNQKFSTTWHGVQEEGQKIAPGVYIVRVQTPSESVEKQLILLR